MNNQNIFDIQNKIQNVSIQDFANNYKQQNYVVNPMIATFEQNRTLKDDKILYYATATTEYKTNENLNDLPTYVKQICSTKNVTCLIGVSRKRFHFQYYSDNGNLLYANCFSRDMVKEIRFSYVMHWDDLSKLGDCPKFAGNDQTLVAKNIRDGIKNKDLII